MSQPTHVCQAFTVIAVFYAICFSFALMVHGCRSVADGNVACERYKAGVDFLTYIIFGPSQNVCFHLYNDINDIHIFAP